MKYIATFRLVVCIAFCLLFTTILFSQATNKIDTIGSVGVGTTNPHSAFEVNGRIISSNLVVGPYSNLNDVTGVTGTLQFGNGNTSFITGSADAYMYKSQSPIGSLPIGTLVYQIRSDVSGGGFCFVGQQTPIPLMTILASGNVGIGTTNAEARLQVDFGSGSQTVLINTEGSSSAVKQGLAIQNPNAYGLGSGASLHFLMLNYDLGTISSVHDGTTSGQQNRMDFSVTDTIPIMSILRNGKIGIGTRSPSSELSVNGYISTKKLIVTQLGWSDYVFNKDYKLRSLQQLEAFIKENNYLPEMPSAKEVEEQGISVGDNQALLLKKIEELTLYVIKQQKNMDEFKMKIAWLQHNINSLSKTRQK